MNVRLQYSFEFPGAIYYDGQLQLNNYSVNLNMVTNATDRVKINIAMERLKVFVHSELAHAVYINQDNAELAEVMYMMGMNMVTLPEEPVDQIIGMMLYCKLNAIMEGVMVVTALDISSTLGDEIWYQHDEEDSIGPFATDGWWFQPTVTHTSLASDPEQGNKVVKVTPNAWAEYNLMWPENVDKPQEKKHTVVYAKFPKHEN